MNSFGSMHYNAIGPALQKQFGKKVVKLSLEAGLTCPNRDGSKGTGGCIFCSADGSGDFAGTIPQQIKLLERKWPDSLYIAYFQSHTNTYAPVSVLRKMWDDALSHENVIGLAIATRPDCLPGDILDLLEEYSKKTFLWVELGLQTSNEKTAALINRCSDNSEYDRACEELAKRNIRQVTHLILGLPGETRADMLSSCRYVFAHKPYGIKLHMLHMMKNTRLAEDYPDLRMMSREEYISLVCDILEETPQDITIHRLTGDAPKELLIAPEWTKNKHAVLNGIQHEFSVRGTWQGSRLE